MLVGVKKWFGVCVAESGWYYFGRKYSVSVCKLEDNLGLGSSFTGGTDGILFHFKSLAIKCCVPLFFLYYFNTLFCSKLKIEISLLFPNLFDFLYISPYYRIILNIYFQNTGTIQCNKSNSTKI